MPAMETLRYADPATALTYPFAVRGSADWRPLEGVWRFSLPLPDLRAGTILVPSLAFDGSDAPTSGAEPHYRWSLHAGGASWSLQQVPGTTPEAPSPAGDVSTQIDCYHIHRRLDSPRLCVDLSSRQPPERYLITVSSRALTVADPPVPTRSEALRCAPAPRSQTTAPAAIAPRICSPTCVSMVLDLWDREHDWLTLVDDCFDPATGMYGVWPMAVRAAARYGSLGAVEAFDGWEEPLQALGHGTPLVTSIRYASGELPGAPMAETGGHLVVVYGAGPEEVLVCDPAAPDGAVVRCYDARAFSGAWLRHRGAAYILPR